MSAARCPFCGGASRHLLEAWDRNREISAERFGYDRCEVCGTVFLASPPADLGRYYRDDYYQFGPDGEPSWKGEPSVIESAAYRVALIGRYVAPGRLIEIGAGTGAFALAAQGAGFDVTAIEMDERCCAFLSRCGIAAIRSDDPLEVLESLPAVRAVALWHVLEHLSSPSEVLERVAAKLEPGGVLAIGVPNPRSLQFWLLKARWAHLDAPRHLCLVPPDAIVRTGEDLGLRCMEMTTNDPDGIACNEFGWIRGFQSRPALGRGRRGAGVATLIARRIFGLVERTGNRGSAVTLVMRRRG